MNKERGVAITETITILIFMSLGNVFNKLALTTIPPLSFAWISIAIGMVCLSMYTFVIRRERIPAGLGRQVWSFILLIGFFNFVVGRIALIISLSLLPATTHTYLTNFIGFIRMIISIFMLKESPTIFQVIGAVIALGGLRVFFTQVPPPTELFGVALIAIGITGVAFTNNVARKLSIVTKNQLSNTVVLTLAILFGGCITILVGLFLEGAPRITGWDNWGILLYSGVIVTAIGLTVWNNILRTLRSYEASILGASTVILTALLAIPILGEELSFNHIIGILLMLIGLSLLQVRAGNLGYLFKKVKQQGIDL